MALKLSKEAAHEYSKARKSAMDKGGRLTRSGLSGAENFKKLSELSSMEDYSRELARINEYRKDKSKTVANARSIQEDTQRAIRTVDNEAKKAERRARHAAAQRRYRERKRLASLTENQRQLLKSAATMGWDFINPRNVAAFANYLEYRLSIAVSNFRYQEFIDAGEDFNRLAKIKKTDPNVIQADFEEYKQRMLEAAEEIGNISTSPKSYDYEQFREAWEEYVGDLEDEVRNVRKRGRKR